MRWIGLAMLFTVSLIPPYVTTADPGGNHGVPMIAMDGATVVTRGERTPKTVRILNADGSVRRLIEMSTEVSSLTVRGNLIALGGYFGTIEVRNFAQGNPQPAQSISVGDHQVTAIAISPDGEKVAFGDDTGKVGHWKLGEQKVAFLTSHRDWVRAITFSPDSKLLATGSFDGSVQIWGGANLKAKVTCGDYVQCLAFAPDSTALAIGGDFSHILVWSITGTTTRIPLSSEQTLSLVFAPDSKRIAAGDDAGIIRIARIDPPRVEKTIGTQRAGVIAIRFEGDTVRAGDFDGNIKTWRMR